MCTGVKRRAHDICTDFHSRAVLYVYGPETPCTLPTDDTCEERGEVAGDSGAERRVRRLWSGRWGSVAIDERGSE